MTWDCPQTIEDAMWRSAKAHLSEHALKRSRLLQSIVDRTLLYTTKRQELSVEKIHDDGDVAARALFFALADVPKMFYVLDELSADQKPKSELRVLDLGSGAGTLTFALAHFFKDRGVSIESTMVEREQKIAKVAKGASENLFAEEKHLNCRFITKDLNAFEPQGTFDFILMGTVLNELSEDLQKKVLKKSFDALGANGHLIVIEPALKKPSRRLHALRDWIVSDCGGHVFAPCTHSNAQCPMLLAERDWCHEDLRSVHPEITQQLSRATGLREDGLKFSYLVVQKDSVNCADGLANPMRVVSRPQKSKVGNTFWGCGEGGLSRIRLSKKSRTSKNKILGKLKRGNVFSLGKDIESDSYELSNSDVVSTIQND